MSMRRRDFLKTSAIIAGSSLAPELLQAQASRPQTQVAASELDELTIADLHAERKVGPSSARALTERYIARIEEIDRNGPAIHSVIELNPDAINMAQQLDAERAARGPRGPLHGIPVLIKDNIATADKMETTAGSLALVGSKPPRDSAVAAKLRAAGAVILGKTNLSEWANFRGDHSTSGWSGRGGLTRNPYALDRNTSGSSSGSGAAVSANLCTVAVGTETDGSIVSPSSINGVVGIKPTVGLVARTGIVPISHTQDTAGPMARTVTDAAILLGALAGADPGDPATRDAGSHATDYTRFLDANGLRGAKLGVVRKLAGFSRHVDQVFDEAIAALKHAGAEIVDPVEVESLGKFDEAETQVLLFEFKADLNRYLAEYAPGAPIRSLKDAIAFNEKNAARELVYFGQEQMEKAEAKAGLDSAEYQKYLADCRWLSRGGGIDAVMDKHKLDALIAPTDSPAWTTDFVNGDHFTGSSSTLPAVAGYPHITVPMGFCFGLPVGLSFFGRAWSEPALIKLAYAYEQATKARKPPSFLPHVEASSPS